MNLNHDTPVQYLKGVGPKIAGLLSKRGIYTASDLLHWYPRAYEDRRAARTISSLSPGEIVSFVAYIKNVRSMNLGRSRRKIYDVSVSDNSGLIHCKYFRTPYKGYFERFQPGMKVRVVGKVTDYRGRIELHHPDIKDFEKEEEQDDELVPLYSETEGINSRRLRKIFASALTGLKEQYPEIFPDWMVEEYQLAQREHALFGIHQPPKGAGKDFIAGRSKFHKRIIFEEFFWLELFLAMQKSGLQKDKAPPFKAKYRLMNQLQESLCFELTGAQKNSLKDICIDLCKAYPMHRLVQGDVGSGKTLVALLSACVAIENSYQVAMMAPTEILASQHFKNAQKFLEPLGLRISLLTGFMTNKQKEQTIEALKAGEVDLCVGTHALIQNTVEFKNLGLVIVDEQHRFGVEQRKSLKQKGRFPHFLVMTATPIPRTLAMTVYGDLDVSIIDELPSGRIPIVTRVVYDSKRQKVMQFLAEQIDKGRQAYIVYPLVEESEKMDLKDAVSQYESLQQHFPNYKLGLLHGKMKDHEKSQIMQEFRENKIQILVSTTVIEVGVDVPNSNIMIIEHAERFGLSQLHQLRGRVGRGSYKSYCVLMLSYAVSEESRERAQLMESCSDGFQIAEADLEIRGPGEFLGRRQSGLPGFRLAHLVRDADILQQAREAAFKLIAKDPELDLEEHSGVKEEMQRVHGKDSLAHIG